MPTPDTSQSRRIDALLDRVRRHEAQLTSLTAGRLASTLPRRDIRLAKTVANSLDSPSYPNPRANKFRIVFLSDDFSAIPGLEVVDNSTDRSFSGTVTARNKTGTYLPPNTHCLVIRQRGKGVKGRGEWWIVKADLPMAVIFKSSSVGVPRITVAAPGQSTGHTLYYHDVSGNLLPLVDSNPETIYNFSAIDFPPVTFGLAIRDAHSGRLNVEVGADHAPIPVKIKSSTQTPAVLTPGGSVECVYRSWDLTNLRWIDTTITATVYDPDFQNYGLEGELFRAHWHNVNNRLEVIGSRGLVRKAVADADITFDGSGLVSIWSAGADSGENVTAHLDWMHEDTDVSQGKQMFVKFFPDQGPIDSGSGLASGQWVITGAECETAQ